MVLCSRHVDLKLMADCKICWLCALVSVRINRYQPLLIRVRVCTIMVVQIGTIDKINKSSNPPKADERRFEFTHPYHLCASITSLSTCLPES